ncbi:MAG: hypothetical protein CM1200mP18_10870 [Gammaproteobacteria bacterium]|nr:MAG: hypothetical protein CM1200mP18_10870 [Gammaproteobacteria bacterium]
MCGRFERHSTLSEFSKVVGGLVAEGTDPLPPSYNIAPSQAALIVRHETGAHRVDPFTWGLVPGWMKETGKYAPLMRALRLSTRNRCFAMHSDTNDV